MERFISARPLAFRLRRMKPAEIKGFDEAIVSVAETTHSAAARASKATVATASLKQKGLREEPLIFDRDGERIRP